MTNNPTPYKQAGELTFEQAWVADGNRLEVINEYDEATVAGARYGFMLARAVIAATYPLQVPEGWDKAAKLADAAMIARNNNLSIPTHVSESMALAILAMDATLHQGGTKP